MMLKSKVKYIIIHCSDSHYGNKQLIDEWHNARGWNGCGYHYVITNCYPTRALYEAYQPHLKSDGAITQGRLETQEGAHCFGLNSVSIGICLIGVGTFTSRQLKALKYRVQKLQYDYGYKLNVLGHCETKSGKEQGKTCPNLSMDWIRNYLEE